MSGKKFKFPYTIKSLEDLPDNIRPLGESLYEKDGDEFIFQGFDESEAKKKTDEFRSTNRKYFNRIKELEGYEAKLKELGDDFDPEVYKQGKEATELKRRLREKELIEKGEVEEVFKARLSSALDPYEKQLKAKDTAISALTQEKDNYKRELDGLVIDGLVSRVAAKVGTPKKGAMPHILNFGRQVWKLTTEGKAQAHLPNGDVWYGNQGQPITEDEWGAKLLEEANFFFESGKGGDSQGGSEEKGTRRGPGNVMYIDRNDVRAMGKYAKEIVAGTVVPV